MPGITEIALLRLTPPATADDAALRLKLARVIEVSEKYTGYRFYYLRQDEDPSLIYLIGHWDSLDQHMNGFIPSAENQSLLESLKNELSIEFFFHIDAWHNDLPLWPWPKEGTDTPEGGDNREDSTVWSIARYFVKDGKRKEFTDTIKADGWPLQSHLAEGRYGGGGWRVDKDEDKEEFVLFLPWRDDPRRSPVDKLPGLSYEVDVKHAKFLSL
ncbi:hypothetical protein K505DRAFT_320142 [Melanomma pulvis-pyrius CBS 109.77]|uniref:ABM domain-containing protein n=1 Tax=Melanomma pulvis-pyrius CBS 109.77 TaxID=1314802 RepID=A0A6A6XXD2_9PLEO|nr:hypothetical protein K505DRAFT_320142 [Melanomma pulvis-pyrius CBS 109.77]